MCLAVLAVLEDAAPAAAEDIPQLDYVRTLLRRDDLTGALRAVQQLLSEDDADDVAALTGKSVRPAPLLRRVERRQQVRQGLRDLGLVR